MLAALPFPLILLILAVALLFWHVRAWQDSLQEQQTAAERGFYVRQYRRRMQVSSMLALLAVAMYVGQVIPRKEYPSLFVFLWAGVVVLVGWMVLLALSDLVDNRFRLARLRDERRVIQARLQAELDRMRSPNPAGPEKNDGTRGDSSTS